MSSYSLRSPFLAASGVLGILAAPALIGDPFHLSGAAAFVILSLAPGAALYLLFEREPRLLELAIAMFLLSPVVTATAGALMVLAGLSPELAGTILLAGSFTHSCASLTINRRMQR